MKFQKSTRSDPAFTIIELIVVLTVAIIVMGIALPSLLSWLPTYRLSAGARQVASDLQLARMKAISQNAKFRLNFISTTQYQFEKDLVADGGPISLPDGITATTLGATSEFQARGTANTGVGNSTITLTNDGGTTMKSIQISVVGRVAIL
ncbi:MAG: GspH/FimT family pseudopilin [Candidatus Binatia bacterium]